MTTLAGVAVTPEQIRGTLKTLKYLRAFLRSECTECRDPYDRYYGGTLTKEQARRKLGWLVNVAINRKAGLLDTPLNHKGRPCRKALSDYEVRSFRDCQALRDIARRIRVYQFETPEVMERFGYRLSSYDD